jgi:adenine-specific DNA-methyltransferase
MAEGTSPKPKKKRAAKVAEPGVENYKHDAAKRRMIPTAEQQGFVPDDDTKPIKLRYDRNPDLDPQLVWRGKDEENASALYVDAPPVYIQEKIHPRQIIERLRAETRSRREGRADQPDLFGDFNGRPEDLEARMEFYAHDQNWSNRMILGDALLVMASLAERENLRGKVQCIYMDPPYGIKFNSNWQVSTGSRDVKDGRADQVSREPEVIKAFRDTWKDGIHSYLSYLRDRLTVARDLLTDSGSIFVQIGDENVHLVRALMDEVFGDKNFVNQFAIAKTSGLEAADRVAATLDYVLHYAKDIGALKFRPIFRDKDRNSGDGPLFRHENLVDTGNPYSLGDLTKPGPGAKYRVAFHGRHFDSGSRWWGTTPGGMEKLRLAERLAISGRTLRFKRFWKDHPYTTLTNFWGDTGSGSFLESKIYVVQTRQLVVERFLVMTTDPGDLVLDPTCGSGTTAYVAEQWGRRWITIDTSRVALALARARVMGAKYPYYLLRDSKEGAAKESELSGRPENAPTFSRDIRQGFVYERAPHVTLKSIANNTEIDVIWERWQAVLEPLGAALTAALAQNWEEWQIPREAGVAWPDAVKDVHAKWWEARRKRQAEIDASIARNADVELLYDRPYEDNKIVRVAGPFTVESLSPHRVIPAHEDPVVLAAIAEERGSEPPAPPPTTEETDFAKVVFEHLNAAGVQNTKKNERLVFESLEPWPGRGYVAFEGRFTQSGKTMRAAIAIGPEYASVGYEFVRAAAREARDAFDMLIVCGFQFAPEVDDTRLNFGRLTVLKARMNQDIRMGDKLKNTGAGNLFVVFGEPDIELKHLDGDMIQVEIKGVDIFDPTTGDVKSSADPKDDIACWFIDDNYDEESFFVRQAYFLGGAAGDPYEALKRALKAEIDERRGRACTRRCHAPSHDPLREKSA